MNDVFDRVKLSTLRVSQPNSIGSVYQISNYLGLAAFSQQIACTNVSTRPTASSVGKITEIICGRGILTDPSGSLIVTSRTTIPTVRITDISGILQTIYVNFSQPSTPDLGYYLYSNRTMLGFQNTTGLSTPSSTPATDRRTNLTAWPQILGQDTPLSLPTSSTADLAITINALITLFAKLGVIVSVPTVVLDPSGVSIDSSGVTLTWSGSLPSYTVYLDKIPVLTGVVENSCHLTLPPNVFAYDISVSGSASIPVSVRNINSNLKDLTNYNPTFGLSPSTASYYRATSPGVVNYIIVIAETLTVTVNTFLLIRGSNASPTTPISLITYFKGSYVGSPLKIVDPGPQVLRYISGSGTWNRVL
jgi:hypothetical protein